MVYSDEENSKRQISPPFYFLFLPPKKDGDKTRQAFPPEKPLPKSALTSIPHTTVFRELFPYFIFAFPGQPGWRGDPRAGTEPDAGRGIQARAEPEEGGQGN